MKQFWINVISLLLLISASSWLGGCNSKPVPEMQEPKETGAHEEEEHDHHEGGEEAEFVEGKGLRLPEEMKKSLGIQIQTITETQLRTEVNETAQVYRSADEKARGTRRTRPGFAYASATIDTREAKSMMRGQMVELQPLSGASNVIQASIVDFDKQMEPFSEHWEAIIEIPDPEKRFAVGTFLKAMFPSSRIHSGFVIPKNALLDAAEGNFVYVEKGEYLARTPVTVGGTTSAGIEITGGLQPGERIVTKSVETLWLIELRLVKGGGHAD